jgi:signal transduction histidine kinase
MNIDLHHLIADKGRIETILDFLPYPFLISESRNNTFHNLYFNRKFKDELGYTIDELPTIDDWFKAAYPDETYREEVMSGWYHKSNSLQPEDTVLMKVIIQTKYNGYQWFEVKSMRSAQFEMVAFVNIGEAIVKEKALERLVENKNRTLSILAHDLRAPITNIHGLSGLFLNDNMTREEFSDQLHQLHLRSGQLLDFIDTTLLWTKANFDSIKVIRVPVSVDDTVTSVLSVYEQNCLSKNLSINVDFESHQLYTDEDILKILLRNTISNAIKFTPDYGTIKIIGKRTSQEYCITVTDQGVGMTPDVLSSILKLDNYQSQPGTRKEKGLGIGLKLCQHLVKKVNAKFEIESSPGNGTTVTISFRHVD